MTDYEIDQSISRLRAEIAAVEQRIEEAEKNIRQLTALRTSCNGYREEVGESKGKRNRKREDIIGVLHQDNFADAYDYTLEEILNGKIYNGAYQNMDEMETEVGREIERQNVVISSCRSEISRLNSSIDSLRQKTDN